MTSYLFTINRNDKNNKNIIKKKKTKVSELIVDPVYYWRLHRRYSRRAIDAKRNCKKERDEAARSSESSPGRLTLRWMTQ